MLTEHVGLWQISFHVHGLSKDRDIITKIKQMYILTVTIVTAMGFLAALHLSFKQQIVYNVHPIYIYDMCWAVH